MAASRTAGSRATSVFSRNDARDILKRRDKPYKTEHNTVLAKRRKLDIHTSYAYGDAPPGYAFVPVGTPDLSDLCKELSRQRGFAVNVVNATPSSKFAQDPDKISHHIHRIGYHFRSEVIEEACSRLGYIVYRNQFVKETDLLKQQQDSFVAKIMMKHGLQFAAQNHRETPEQVQAAIKELFPRIPQEDLDQIVKHAWEEGTNRVGTNQYLDLPRRVQLAVIARIRHTHTDYDRLLRAFDWKDARKEVEPDCLKKLIEWRGENEDEDDNELEEIVRETIVIDDDENARDHGHDADTEDSTPGDEPGNVSDTSIEISHRPAAPEDLRAEDPRERDNRYLNRYQPMRRTVAERNTIARAKIDAIRGQMREKPAQPAFGYRILPPERVVERPPVVHTHVRMDQNGAPPREIVVDGMVMRRASPDQSSLSSATLGHPYVKHGSLYQHIPSIHPTPVPARGHIRQVSGLRVDEQQTQAVPSIERGDMQTANGKSSRLVTPEGDYTESRQQPYPINPHHQSSDLMHTHPFEAQSSQMEFPADAMDLSSPRYASGGKTYYPLAGIPGVSGQYGNQIRDLQLQHGTSVSMPSTQPRIVYLQDIAGDPRREPNTYSNHGPSQPANTRPSQAFDVAPPAAVRQVWAVPSAETVPQVSAASGGVGRAYYDTAYVEARPSQPERMQYQYADAYPLQQTLQRIHVAPAPRPVHGAPAPVQQIPVSVKPSTPQRSKSRATGLQQGYTEDGLPMSRSNSGTLQQPYQKYYYSR